MTQSIDRTTPAIDEMPLQFWEGDRVRGQSLKDNSTIEGTVQSVGRKYLKLTSGEAVILSTAQMLDPGAEVIELDPRMQSGAYVSTPGGLKAYVLKADPKEPDTRVIIEYVNKGMGTDNYPYRNLTLIQAAPEPEPRRAIAPTPAVDIDEDDDDEGPDLKVGDRVWYGEATNTGVITDLQYPDVAVRFDHGETVTVAYHRLHLVETSDEGKAQYTPGFLTADEAARLFEFSEALDWQHNSFRIFGRETKLPRLEVMFGDPGCTYRYSHVELEPLPWPPELQALREKVEAATGCKYQVVIGNLYRSGADHIGWHADDSPEMGRNPAIASISLGATRRFDVRSKAGGEVQSFELGSGDLVFMPSGFQSTHKHRIALVVRSQIEQPVGVML
ncbi:alpha-ketoglutarate-dependent dioxygenase AlkB [Leptolyngbya sp. FACHB-16]|uniref:alpha-ketoglutarate-dependent dioxygenase AlkB family protein n=1 Tax=unclassified Leptolyngbya TaxID=2650499 RepID=UPI0016878B0B|nr:alpha-ketoglutarate-dependent dioxygenase AlkB [Leptolyngbya sp. FACHB-16]MBD2156288.1 alpha-ketoglutarate-dependent dioxygenase AlkB [Leptolyngbya sp. FACHB-16]